MTDKKDIKVFDDTSKMTYTLLDEKSRVDDLETKLKTLYQTPHSDMVYLNMYDHSISQENCRKLFIYEDNALKQLLLFKYEGNESSVTILNTSFTISSLEIKYISNVIFYEFSTVGKVIFQTLFLDCTGKIEMTVYEKTLYDAIMDLPASMDVYMKSLGTQTRKHVKYYQNRIQKDFPGFNISFQEGEDIKSGQIARIVDMNRDRMKSKGKKSGIDEIQQEYIYQYAQINGMLCLCTVDEEIIGGTINTIIGEHAYLHVIAHDNQYNKYNTGQVALVNTVQYLIGKNVKHFHLFWGEYDYKYRFLCKNHDLYDITVYRKKGAYMIGKTSIGIRVFGKSLKSSVRKRLENNKTLKKVYRKACKLFIK
ncbi:MAG: GNAT family N-acetyltransferase [Bacteroidales bacterium]|jgi:hypothetical protein|nr:GNAT family N-acetyltransferase [Bacteroidales bacterium]